MLSVTTSFGQQDSDTQSGQRDNVILDDLIVDGSACVGMDCVDGENFGFDTVRLKENNLRIHFDDTSASGSFPGNDWRITINDSENGGANYFAIDDATAGTNPFKILAGAGNYAFYIDAQGDVGLGTNNPVAKLQVTDGDTPTMRLEQNGSVGWSPQTWDVAGNEANFFVRDATNGSLLPFRIKPGAPTNSIFVAATGAVGLGTQEPNSDASLDLAATNKALLLNRLTTASRTALDATAIAGMLVYDTDENKIFYYDGTTWESAESGEDNQNLTAATLAGTTLTVAIEDGAAVDVDLAPILTPLQDAITDLENENTAQQAQIDALMARMDAIEACACGGTLSVNDTYGSLHESESIRLNQNTPNPFQATTTIAYYIPTQYNTASIQVVSTLGQVVYDIPITKFGDGSVTLTKDNMQSAVYFYTLYVDGKKIASKRLMVD